VLDYARKKFLYILKAGLRAAAYGGRPRPLSGPMIKVGTSMFIAAEDSSASWIQLLPTLAAGLLGFVGVVYGAAWTARAEHQRWLRQELLNSTVSFVKSCSELLRDVQLAISMPMDQDRPDDAAKGYYQVYGPTYITVTSEGLRLGILAPHDLSQTIDTILEAVDELNNRLGEFDFPISKGEWEAAKTAVEEKLVRFIDSMSAITGPASKAFRH
jgi:hypothetical protein